MKMIDAKLKEISNFVRKNVLSVDLREDVEQEAIVIALEHPEIESVEIICKLAKKKILGTEAKHQINRAQSLYNDDGECVDDNIYFVDQSTVEQYGERKSEVTDEQREKVSKFSQCMGLIGVINQFKQLQKSRLFFQRRKLCI